MYVVKESDKSVMPASLSIHTEAMVAVAMGSKDFFFFQMTLTISDSYL